MAKAAEGPVGSTQRARGLDRTSLLDDRPAMARLSSLAFPLLLVLLVLIWAIALALGGPSAPFDLELLHRFHDPALVPAARLLTHMGNWQYLLPIALGVAGWMWWRGRKREAVLLLAIFLGAQLLIDLQKYAFDRARPDPSGRLVVAHFRAFPSGHAGNSMATLLGIALIAFGGRWWAIVTAIALSAAIASTRLILAVHWPTDVVGGWAFGAFWALLLVRLFAPKRR